MYRKCNFDSSIQSFDEVQNQHSGSKEHNFEISGVDNSLLDDNKSIKDKDTEKNNILGILYMIFCGLSISIIYIICKVVFVRNPSLTGLDSMITRSPLMVFISILQLAYCKVNPFNIHPEIRWALVGRVIGGGIAILCSFISLKYLPSSKLSLITYIHPLIVAVIAFYLLSEVLTKIHVISFIGSFIGIILLACHNTKSTVDTSTDSEYYFGLMMVSIATV